MKLSILIFTISILTICSSKDLSIENEIYKSDTLIIYQLNDNVYRHVSYLATKQYGNVACNGMIFTSKGEAAVFDTPVSNEVSKELISFIEEKLKSEVKALVINHFHVDCLGGIETFHHKGVPSFGSLRCIAFAKSEETIAPLNGFEKKLVLDIGTKKIENYFFGEAHTKDNIFSYLPSEKIAFGGCMLKGLGAGKGNIADANVEEWPKTIQKIKNAGLEIDYLIPGHGATGTNELLDYTIDVFQK